MSVSGGGDGEISLDNTENIIIVPDVNARKIFLFCLFEYFQLNSPTLTKKSGMANILVSTNTGNSRNKH